MSDYYLDAGATTPVDNEAYSAMIPYFKDNFYNPSADYTPAYNVSKDIENARAYIADYVGALPSEVYFTSCASESNSWAIQGWIRKHQNGRVITTNIEHHSIMAIAEDPFYSKYIDVISVDDEGFILLETIYDAIEKASNEGIEPEDILVAVQYANNEIGTVQDILFLAEAVKATGAYFFTDATQAFACSWMELGFSKNIDMMSMSGHKIGAPKGIGILFIKNGIDLPPLIYGTQNFGKRGGTENVPYIMALKEAFKNVKHGNKWKIGLVAESLFEEINRITPVKLNGGSRGSRLPNNLNITFENKIIGQAIMSVLSAIGVYVSTGSACNAHSDEVSHVLKAIGLSEEDALRTIRITLPDNISMDDIPTIASKFRTAIELLLEESD